jgi:hypothetical protein
VQNYLIRFWLRIPAPELTKSLSLTALSELCSRPVLISVSVWGYTPLRLIGSNSLYSRSLQTQESLLVTPPGVLKRIQDVGLWQFAVFSSTPDNEILQEGYLLPGQIKLQLILRHLNFSIAERERQFMD